MPCCLLLALVFAFASQQHCTRDSSDYSVFEKMLLLLTPTGIGTALIPMYAIRVQGALLLASRFCIREPATTVRVAAQLSWGIPKRNFIMSL